MRLATWLLVATVLATSAPGLTQPIPPHCDGGQSPSGLGLAVCVRDAEDFCNNRGPLVALPFGVSYGALFPVTDRHDYYRLDLQQVATNNIAITMEPDPLNTGLFNYDLEVRFANCMVWIPASDAGPGQPESVSFPAMFGQPYAVVHVFIHGQAAAEPGASPHAAAGPAGEAGPRAAPPPCYPSCYRTTALAL